MAIQIQPYIADGSTRAFPQTKYISNKSLCRVFGKSNTSGLYEIINSNLYDVINNAIVFAEPLNILLYSSFEIRIGDNEDELGDSLSDIAILASIADDIVNTSSISADVSIVSDISDKVVIVANNDTSVTSVANNMVAVQDVHNNLAEILECDTNAAIATTKAAEALASANASQASRLVSDANKIATNSDVLLTHADVLATNADVITTTANAAAAATSETNAELSEWESEASKLTTVSYATEAEDVVVNIVTSDGDGTYTYTPQIGVYSSLHHELKAATFNPSLYVTIDSPALVNPTINGVAQSGYSGFKNLLINGGFDVWQRGTSQTSSGYGSDDRWTNRNDGSTKTHSRVACTDTERALFNASYFSRTVVSSVAGVGNRVSKYQLIEDITKLAGKTVTLSFWAKADSNKNIAIEFVEEFGAGGTPSSVVLGIGSQLVSLTSTYQKKTITVTLPSSVGKTLGTDGVHTTTVAVAFWFDAGSNFNSRTASLGQQSGTFDIAQVQLEEGSVATPFEQRPIGLELSLCQRYYEVISRKLFSTGRPGFGGNTYFGNMSFHNKRVTPQITLYDSSNNANKVTLYQSATATDNVTYIIESPSTNNMNIVANGFTDYGLGAINKAILDAEIY